MREQAGEGGAGERDDGGLRIERSFGGFLKMTIE